MSKLTFRNDMGGWCDKYQTFYITRATCHEGTVYVVQVFKNGTDEVKYSKPFPFFKDAMLYVTGELHDTPPTSKRK